MPHIIDEDGNKSKEFPGHDLEPGIWNVGFLGEWYTHTTYLPVAHTESYKYAKEKYELAQKLTSCGVRVVLCFGNVSVDPYNLDENGKEIPPCCLDESCSDCVEWSNYCDPHSYPPERGPVIDVIDNPPWGIPKNPFN